MTAFVRTPAAIDLTGDPIPFTSLPSACPVPGVTAADRADPFWQGMWADGSQSSWLSRDLEERIVSDGIRRAVPGDLDRSRLDARDELLAGKRAQRLAALAATGMWRTPSVEQLAAIVGYRAVANNPKIMLPAFQAGLVERGAMIFEMVSSRPGRLNYLYRPIDGIAFDALAERLTYDEWMGVTAGYPWSRGTQSDRHNLLTCELALRIAEFCDVASVLGESLSRLDLLSHNVIKTQQAAADATVVRGDGMRIAIELTANSIGPAFQQKVRRWAETLYDTPDDETGLAVLFVEAAGPDRRTDARREIWRVIRTTVAQAAHEIPGAVRRAVPQRMAVARWKWWFPRSWSATEHFPGLTAARPTGPPAAPWEYANLLDPFELVFEPKDPAGPQALIDNSASLLGVPQWLRQKITAERNVGLDFSGTLLRLAGLTQVPVPLTEKQSQELRRSAG